MTINWEAILSGAFSGGLIGAIASLIAPWSKWGIEKQRIRFERRKEKLRIWRNNLQEIAGIVGDPVTPIFRETLQDNTSFIKTALYAEIEIYLRPVTRKALESMKADKEHQRDVFRMALADLAALERKWRII